MQFPVSLVLTLHGDEQGRCIAKIVHNLYGHDIGRQLRLERCHSVFELAPELILVVQVVIQFHLDKGHTVAGR